MSCIFSDTRHEWCLSRRLTASGEKVHFLIEKFHQGERFNEVLSDLPCHPSDSEPLITIRRFLQIGMSSCTLRNLNYYANFFTRFNVFSTTSIHKNWFLSTLQTFDRSMYCLERGFYSPQQRWSIATQLQALLILILHVDWQRQSNDMQLLRALKNIQPF